MPGKQSLIIFLRYPEQGKVKTRLAKTTNDTFATKVYKLCSEHVINKVTKNKSDYSVFIYYDGYVDEDKYRNWLNSDFEYHKQTGDDLGEKMLNAIKYVLEMGYEKALLIGTDIPDINLDIITKAFAELDESSVVLLPAFDGGYTGIGMRVVIPEIFEGIKWGTGLVIYETIRKLNNNGRNFALLKPLLDLDTENDLKTWLEENYDKPEDELYKLIFNYYVDTSIINN